MERMKSEKMNERSEESAPYGKGSLGIASGDAQGRPHAAAEQTPGIHVAV